MTETAQPLLTWTSVGTVTGMALVVSGFVSILATILGITSAKSAANRALRLLLLAVAGAVTACMILGYIWIETPDLDGPKFWFMAISNVFAVWSAATASNALLKAGEAALRTNTANMMTANFVETEPETFFKPWI